MTQLSLKNIWIMLIAATMFLAALFLLFPQIDTAFSNLFFAPNQAFIHSPMTSTLRDIFRTLFAIGFVFSLLMLFLSFLPGTPPKIARSVWLFAASACIVGPGIVVNLILKNNWGRARPAYIEAFGGEKTFSPPFIISDQCAHNCSFVSGETSSIVTLSLLFCILLWTSTTRKFRRGLIGLSLCLTLLASTLRIAMGRHFLSDTLFSALFSAMIVLILFQLFSIAKHRQNVSPAAVKSDLLRLMTKRN